MARRNVTPQDRNGLATGDTVTASPASGYAEYGPGTVVRFLDEKSAANNGAALVKFLSHPTWGSLDPKGPGIQAFVNNNLLNRLK